MNVYTQRGDSSSWATGIVSLTAKAQRATDKKARNDAVVVHAGPVVGSSAKRLDDTLSASKHAPDHCKVSSFTCACAVVVVCDGSGQWFAGVLAVVLMMMARVTRSRKRIRGKKEERIASSCALQSRQHSGRRHWKAKKHKLQQRFGGSSGTARKTTNSNPQQHEWMQQHTCAMHGLADLPHSTLQNARGGKTKTAREHTRAQWTRKERVCAFVCARALRSSAVSSVSVVNQLCCKTAFPIKK
jgi:hypothetical protein